MADRGQVAQALMNLCLNALDAVGDHGRVLIEAVGEPLPHLGRPDPYAVLRVSDDGVGMDAATREQAFEPFFTTKPVGRGTGLGLSMVYGVARSHEGWVDIVSAPGQGTTVTLAFPLAAAADAPAPLPAGAGRRVLVVDDDGLVRKSMRRLLEAQGFVVEEADNGRVALDRLGVAGAPDVDVLLLDVVMPELDGLATLERLRQTRPGLGVLLYSGYADAASQRRIEVDDHTAFCTKPIDRSQLVRTLDGLARASPRA